MSLENLRYSWGTQIPLNDSKPASSGGGIQAHVVIWAHTLYGWKDVFMMACSDLFFCQM